MEKLYKGLKEKHSLPDFDTLNQEFEISLIEEEDFFLRSIRKNIIEKIDFTLDILDDILHPESGFSSYKESGAFSDGDRDDIFKLYRQLMFFKRLSTELSFGDSDAKNAKFVTDFMAEWPKMKETVLVFVKKLKESWQGEIAKKEIVGYLG
ncbi:MAG: hypothetical protein V1729_05020 [Candidatus Woesearchaeota archaeon]